MFIVILTWEITFSKNIYNAAPIDLHFLYYMILADAIDVSNLASSLLEYTSSTLISLILLTGRPLSEA